MARTARAGPRKTSATRFRRRTPGPSSSGGAAATGGSTAKLSPELIYFPDLYALAAADSSDDAMPLTFFGFFRKSWKILNSPCPTVAPKDAGWRSDMSKRKVLAVASATAVARVSGSEYADGGTFLFGDENPPRLAQIVAAWGVARYLTSARAAGL